MSKCKEDMTPGPQTTIHGRVTDVKTGQGIANVSLQIWKEYHDPLNIDGGGIGVSAYDTVSTQADGRYALAFIPKGTGTFTFRLRDAKNNFVVTDAAAIKIGEDNTADFKLYKAIVLEVNVHNNSNHGRKSFMLGYTSNTAYYDSGYLTNVVTDKHYTFRVPHLSTLSMLSNFNNGYSPTVYNKLIDTLVFRQSLNIGIRDTSINIINP